MATMISIYLAGPIDGIGQADARRWREEIAADYPGVLMFNPLDAWLNTGPGVAAILDHANRHVIASCSAVLANLSGDGRGFGTIREIEFARTIGKLVAVAGPLVSLLQHDLIVAETVNEAMGMLLEQIATNLENRPPSLIDIIQRQIEDSDEN